MDLLSLRQSLPEVGTQTQKVCVVCQEPADKKCSACNKVDYCSVEHQKAHWKAGHKNDCNPMMIAKTPELGRHYLAARDLPAGTLLHTELPVFIIPPSMPKDWKVFSCIVCHVLTDWQKAYGCSKCDTWVFCSRACSKSKIHLEAECFVLSQIKADDSDLTEELPEQFQLLLMEYDVKLILVLSYPYLAYLRAFSLKNKDPETWARIMELKGGDRFNLQNADEKDQWFIKGILPLLGQEGVDFAAEMLKFKGIFGTNALPQGTVEFTLGHSVGNADILYLMASQFTNACIPNCSTKIGEGTFPLEVKTLMGVKKGQVLTMDYTRILFPSGAFYRQHIEQNKRGLCFCPRCIDPSGTELGTMFSAVKCIKPGCQDGYLLPVKPLDMAMSAPWRCNRKGCKGKSTYVEIDEFVFNLSDEMKVFFENLPKNDIHRTREFLERLRSKLHPNHWFIVLFQMKSVSIISLKTKRRVKLSTPKIHHHISMLEDLLRIADVVAPGLTLARARILAQLSLKLQDILTRIHDHEDWIQLMGSLVKVNDQMIAIARKSPQDWGNFIKYYENNQETIRMNLMQSIPAQLAFPPNTRILVEPINLDS